MTRTKLLLTITIAALAHIGCTQNKQNSTQTPMTVTKEQYNSISKGVKKYPSNPTYSLQVNAIMCTYEIFVNGMPAFFSFTPGNTAGEQSIDIPQYILRSGKQKIQIKVYPKAIEAGVLEPAISPQAVFTVRVVHFEYGKTPMNEVQVASIKLPQQTHPVPMYEWSGEFDAQVPYTLKGWSQGQDLSKEDPHALQQEVLTATERYRNAFEKKDVPTIASMIYEREKEVAQALYLVSGEQGSYDHGWENLEQQTKELLQMKPIDGYEMRLFADNRVVALVKNTGRFRDFPVVYGSRENNKLRFYAIYFFRPKAGAPLEIIR